MVGGTGFLFQGVDNYTYYYSLTEIAVSGSLTVNGVTEPVSGVAWIDRQYGDFNPNTGEDYEWFSLQLSNEIDINLWNIFTFQDEIPDTPTYRYLSAYIDENTSLTNSEFDLDRLSYAWMPDGEVCYAQQWRLTIPEIEAALMITARHPDQEVALPFRFYEGTTDIEGTIGGPPVTGRSFAELLKHYQHPLLSTSPTSYQRPRTSQKKKLRSIIQNRSAGSP